MPWTTVTKHSLTVLLFFYHWLETASRICESHRLVKRAPTLIRLKDFHFTRGQWCKMIVRLSKQAVRWPKWMSRHALKGRAYFFTYSPIRVPVTLLHQLTAFIIKLSGLGNVFLLSEYKKKTNIHEVIKWLHSQASTCSCELRIHVWTLTCNVWKGPHFAGLTAVSPAIPQMWWSRPCSGVMLLLCLVGHWSSPPLPGHSISPFSCIEVTSHLQASYADCEIWVRLCVAVSNR